MNRGDFIAVHLPKTFRIVANGRYQVVNGCTQTTTTHVAGFGLGSFSGAAPAALNIAIPPAVLSQLTNEKLVTATAINLYDDARDPSKSAANMARYLALLQALAPADVNDGP
jgi:hypothetical protein